MGSVLIVPVEYKRSLPHPRYSLEIQSFSLLSTLDKYESDVFEAGGLQMSLSLYPKGDKANNGSGYISFYLSIKETDNYRLGWEVHANYNLFVYDKNLDKYWTIQDADGPVRRFHSSNTQWGFPQFLSLETFKKPSNGYLQDDSCIFGADVLVIQPTRKVESLNLIKFEPLHKRFTRQSRNVSQLEQNPFYYEGSVGKSNWELWVYPEGYGAEKCLYVFLEARGLPRKRKVYVEFKLRLLNQLNRNHEEEKVSGWLSASAPSMHCQAFMPLEDLQNPDKGFIINDDLTMEAQLLAMSTVRVETVG